MKVFHSEFSAEFVDVGRVTRRGATSSRWMTSTPLKPLAEPQ